jgi:hypothetical protein
VSGLGHKGSDRKQKAAGDPSSGFLCTALLSGYSETARADGSGRKRTYHTAAPASPESHLIARITVGQIRLAQYGVHEGKRRVVLVILIERLNQPPLHGRERLYR